MATENGHHANRVYRDQDGHFHLNGASFFNDAEEDISDSLEELNSLSPTEIGYLDDALPGTVAASTVVVYDSAGKIVKNVATPAAAGTNQGTATALTKNLNAVTAADGTKGVALPVGAAGDEIIIINTDASSVLKVYPETGGAINGGSANASVSVGPGRGASFVCTAALTWYVAGESLATATISTLNAAVAGVAAGYKIARGQHTTVSATDTVVTGLATVVSVVATLDADPGDDPFLVSATIGDQTGTPAAGSVIIKTWKHDGTDPTPTAASTFSKKVNWIAVGT